MELHALLHIILIVQLSVHQAQGMILFYMSSKKKIRVEEEKVIRLSLGPGRSCKDSWSV